MDCMICVDDFGFFAINYAVHYEVLNWLVCLKNILMHFIIDFKFH